MMAKAMQQIDAVLEYLYNRKDDENPVLIDDIQADEKLLKIAGNKHELVRIINQLISDNYIHRYPDYPKLPDGKNDMKGGLLTYCPITFDGRLFWESGGYEKNLKREKVAEFPKKYWYLIAGFAFIIGLFTDVIKTAISQMLLPNSQKSEQVPPTYVDTHQNRKTHPDTLYLLNDTIYVKPLK